MGWQNLVLLSLAVSYEADDLPMLKDGTILIHRRQAGCPVGEKEYCTLTWIHHFGYMESGARHPFFPILPALNCFPRLFR